MIPGIVIIIMRMFVICDNRHEIFVLFMVYGIVSWTRAVAENNLDGNTNRGPGFLGASLSPLPSSNENINYDSLAKGPTIPWFHGPTEDSTIAELKQAKPMCT